MSQRVVLWSLVGLTVVLFGVAMSYGGTNTKTSALNDVISGINQAGDI